MLPGGPSDKLGNRYELWWTVDQLERLLQGEVESIRLEEPGLDKIEFVAHLGAKRELHQAKRANIEGKWSLATLASSQVGVLDAIYAQLHGNSDDFIFASSSDAPGLAELSDRARQSSSVDEFQAVFLDAESRSKDFERIANAWHACDVATARDILRRVHVRTIDERSLIEKVRANAKALFLADPIAVCNEIRSFATDNVHALVTRETLLAHLTARGFLVRRLSDEQNAGVVVAEALAQYLNSARKKLIRGQLIARPATCQLLSNLGTPAGDAVLIGQAGSGKTACLVEYIDELRKRGVPVLAFRLDRIDPTDSAADLGRRLGFEESPALVLAAAAQGREAILIVDQLDAVSTTSGRSTSFFDAVDDLLTEARGLRHRLQLHVVVVCRRFDWDNDHRLKKLLSKSHAEITVTPFEEGEVKTVLTASGFDPAKFSHNQITLLRLAQNLSLFLDSDFDPAGSVGFNTAADLFDRYWTEKRQVVRHRAGTDEWMQAIQLTVQEMAVTQQLSVRREVLDALSPEYLTQLTSEGVLVQDGARYGFGHESFFDYCFARWFVAQGDSLVAFLVKSEQHLFRRAQVRQVLAYLRDADRARYLQELRTLLQHRDVRAHLKDVAFALLANVPDPTDDEWAIWLELLQPFLDALATKVTPSSGVARLAWIHLFGAVSWFSYLHAQGIAARWLEDSSGLTDLALQYVRLHQRHSPDAVVDLLKPYVGEGGDWAQRLANLVSWSTHVSSRAYFEFVLSLVDDGTLDEARSPIAQNGTFWSMFHSLAKAQPDWTAELLAHWLKRRLVIASTDPQGLEKRHSFGRDTFAVKPIHESAGNAPKAFVDHVLPAVLEISDAGTPASSELPKRDAIWGWAHKTTHGDEITATFDCLVSSLSTIAADPASDLATVIDELKRRETHLANALLLTVYTAGANRFGDDASALLSSEPWRLQCGYSDSPRWIAVTTIQAIAPLCSGARLQALETVLLGYLTPWEQTTEGERCAGLASFTFLSAIPPTLRSAKATLRIEELQQTFGKPEQPPRRGARGGIVRSPIKDDAAKAMSDDDWLRKIAEHKSDDRSFSVDDEDGLTGGALEVARQVGALATNEPERFARLALSFPAGTHHYYFDEVLRGIERTQLAETVKIDVCRAAYAAEPLEVASPVAHVLAQMTDPLPPDAVQILTAIATEHSDPSKEMWQEPAGNGRTYYNGEIYSCGINTARGAGVMAIGNLIQEEPSNIQAFGVAIGRMIVDPSACVQSCVAYVLRTIAAYDFPQALSLLLDMPIADDRVLATDHFAALLQFAVRDHYDKVLPTITRMMQSTDPDVAAIAGRLAAIAALFHEKARDMERSALKGSPKQRFGIAEVAAANIAQADWRPWCEERLIHLFDDADDEVRRQANTCFRNLDGEPLENQKALIEAFCKSKAFDDDSSAVLHCLEESKDRLPGITCHVCETFLERFGSEAGDWRSRRMGDGHVATALVFRTYQQHQQDEWTKPCLDLIDRLCLDGWGDVREALDAFER